MLSWDNRLEQSLQRIFLYSANNSKSLAYEKTKKSKSKIQTNTRYGGFLRACPVLVSIHQLWDADICHSTDNRSGKHHNTITALFTPNISCYVVKG